MNTISMIGCAKGGDSPFYAVHHDQDHDLLWIYRDDTALPLGPYLPEEFPVCSDIINSLAFGADYDGRLTEVYRRLTR